MKSDGHLRRATSVAFFVATSLGIGCTVSDGIELATVSGRITVDGQPASHVYIEFQPKSSGDPTNPGPMSVGFADADGRFTVATQRGDRDGAVVGTHSVTIFGAESAGMVDSWRKPPSPEMIAEGADPGPEKPRTRPTIEVPREGLPARFDVPPGGTDAADFDL